MRGVKRRTPSGATCIPQIQNYIDLANAIMAIAIEDYGHGLEMYCKGREKYLHPREGTRDAVTGKVLISRAVQNIRSGEIFLRSGYFATLCRGEYDGDDLITYMRRRYGFTDTDEQLLYEVGKC